MLKSIMALTCPQSGISALTCIIGRSRISKKPSSTHKPIEMYLPTMTPVTPHSTAKTIWKIISRNE